MAEGCALVQQAVYFSFLVKKAVEDSYSSLQELTGIAPEQSDLERKLGLLKYVLKTRQRLLRLLVLSKWCRQIPLVERCQQLEGTLTNHDTSFTQAADFLFFLHEGLQQARAPVYDIPAAAEVLLIGNYSRLPKCIEDLGLSTVLAGERRETTLHKLNTMLRSRLLDMSFPKEISAITVSYGRAFVRVYGEFEVQLTLGYRGNLLFWRILHLQLLVGEIAGPVLLTELQRVAVGDDLERRMAASDDPFRILYSVLHEFCTTLVMDTLFRQTGMLRQGRWKDAIRYEKFCEDLNNSQGENNGQGPGPGPPGEVDSDLKAGTKSRGAPGLKIWYWLDCPKGKLGIDPTAPPHLRIEPGPDQNLLCLHQPSVIDPATDNEAEFIIDQSCIDVERLLLRAIACNIHSRLLEVRRGLKSNSVLWRVDCDVVLKSFYSEDELQKGSVAPEEKSSGSLIEAGEEVLCVRAYGASFMALGISIRNGRFLLRFPSTLLPTPVLVEMEDALNQGSVAPADVFLNLRSKSLLNVFASIGISCNLKIYERGALVLKLPTDTPKLGSEVLVMGFPNCGGTYFLSLDLDSNFMPGFRLLEAQPCSLCGGSSFLSGPIDIIRSIMISIETILVTEDDASFSLLDEGSLEVEKQSTPAFNANLKRVKGKNMQEWISKKEEENCSRLRRVQVLDGSNAELNPVIDQHHRGSPAGQFSRSSNSMLGPYCPLPSPSGLQVFGSTNQQCEGSTIMIQGPNGSFPLGIVSPSDISHLQSNYRVGRIGLGNGLISSPVKSPLLHKGVMNLKSPYHGDQDVLQSKSPLHGGESASSPIDLDDDDISKLIDSISSKTGNAVSGGSHSSLGSDGGPLSTHHARLVLSRPVAMVKSPAVYPRISQSRALTSSQVCRQSATSVIHLGSPRKNFGSQSGAEEWMEHDQSSQSVQSSISLPLPPVWPSTAGVQLTNSFLSTRMVQCDSFKRQRCGAELLFLLPSIQGVAVSSEMLKKRKRDFESSEFPTGQWVGSHRTLPLLDSFVGQPFATIVAAANHGKAPMGTYRTALLQIVRRCWLCIKNARLTRQMDALGIHYVEEVGLGRPSSNLRFRFPVNEVIIDSREYESAGWQQICLCLGKLGSDGWEVELQDAHFRDLWDLRKQNASSAWGSNVQFATLTEQDSHIQCTQKGLVLAYSTVQDDSIKRMVTDLERLWNARMFAVGIRRLLEEKIDDNQGTQKEFESEPGKGLRSRRQGRLRERNEGGERKWEVMRRAFRVEAVGLTSIWFTYVGLVPGMLARFVVEWEVGHRGCTVHVSPEQLWPHTKYLEDFINGGEVDLLLDCIRVTVGPLSSLASAIRPARMLGPAPNPASASVSVNGQSPVIPSKPAAPVAMLGQVSSPSLSSTASLSAPAQGRLPSGSTLAMGTTILASQAGSLVSSPHRPLSGLVPSSLLPTDVSVLLRTPYWIRIVYRKQFAMDMRCFGADQVWLQPAPPPRSGELGIGGSLPCPQFRPFVMEHVTLGLNSAESLTGGSATLNQSSNGVIQTGFTTSTASWGSGSSPGCVRGNPVSMGATRSGSNASVFPNRVGNLQGGSQSLTGMTTNQGRGVVIGSNVGIRGEYSALFGLGDDGGYGGAWVPLAALKKVLRGTLRYLGVLWLFAQFPNILREVLGSILRENEGSLLNHDPEQPALRFFIGNCVFAVSMHRQQLYLQAINVKKFQQQQQLQQTNGPESELSSSEMQEIGDFFNRRVASEPYDASRVASFITMLTLPVPVLRDFLKLIAWKKEQQKASIALGQGGDALGTARPKVELCLENRSGLGLFPGTQEEVSLGAVPVGGSFVAKSSIQHHRAQSTVEFTLTLHLDAILVPPVNVGGAGWLPQCVAVRLRYQFSEPSRVSVVNIEGSHGGRACWQRPEDWDRCKAGIIRAVDHQGAKSGAEPGQCRLKSLAEFVQGILHSSVLQLRRVVQNAASPMGNSFQSQC